MKFNRRSLALGGAVALGAAVIGGVAQATAQTGDEAAVRQAVEALRKAMLGADRAQLEAIAADKLLYGHSGGKLDDRAGFIAGASKAPWKSFVFSDETVSVAGNYATCRVTLTGENESDGKVKTTKRAVLLAWVKQDGHWKLMSLSLAHL